MDDGKGKMDDGRGKVVHFPFSILHSLSSRLILGVGWAIMWGKLPFGKVREMAAMTVWPFQQLLGSRGITVHYNVEDYEEYLATLKELGRL